MPTYEWFTDASGQRFLVKSAEQETTPSVYVAQHPVVQSVQQIPHPTPVLGGMTQQPLIQQPQFISDSVSQDAALRGSHQQQTAPHNIHPTYVQQQRLQQQVYDNHPHQSPVYEPVHNQTVSGQHSVRTEYRCDPATGRQWQVQVPVQHDHVRPGYRTEYRCSPSSGRQWQVQVPIQCPSPTAAPQPPAITRYEWRIDPISGVRYQVQVQIPTFPSPPVLSRPLSTVQQTPLQRSK